MNTTVAGLLTGLALGFAGYFGGFGALVVVAVVGLAGLIVGRLVRGDVHVADYLRRPRDGEADRKTFEHRRSTRPAASRTRQGTQQRTRVQ